MDYLHFSNEARTIARQIAVMSKDDVDDYFKVGTEYTKTDTLTYSAHLYNVSLVKSIGCMEVSEEDEDGNSITATDKTKAVDAVVTVTFKRKSDLGLPRILTWINFPPETISPIVYKMKLDDKEFRRSNS